MTGPTECPQIASLSSCLDRHEGMRRITWVTSHTWSLDTPGPPGSACVSPSPQGQAAWQLPGSQRPSCGVPEAGLARPCIWDACSAPLAQIWRPAGNPPAANRTVQPHELLLLWQLRLKWCPCVQTITHAAARKSDVTSAGFASAGSLI